MFLRAPDTTEPFAGKDLVLWSMSQCKTPWNPCGTITDQPGAGQIPVWPRVPVWPHAPSLATTWTPYFKSGLVNPYAPVWGLGGGLGAISPGDISTIVNTALPAIAREVEAVARRAVEQSMFNFVLPPVVLTGTVALVALVLAASAYRKTRNPGRPRRRRFILRRKALAS